MLPTSNIFSCKIIQKGTLVMTTPEIIQQHVKRFMVKREIKSTDRGIDGLVYELYGVSEEELRIVEGR